MKGMAQCRFVGGPDADETLELIQTVNRCEAILASKNCRCMHPALVRQKYCRQHGK